MNISDHQRRIAEDTLRMNPVMAAVMGGPTPDEAAEFLVGHRPNNYFIEGEWYTEHMLIARRAIEISDESCCDAQTAMERAEWESNHNLLDIASLVR